MIERRKMFQDRADATLKRTAIEESRDKQTIAELSEKIQRRVSAKRMSPNDIKPSEYKEPIPIALRKRRGMLGPLSIDDKIHIVYKVLE